MTGLFDLSEQVVVVAGGAGRIGPAVCEALGEHGATVVVADIDAATGERVADDAGGVFVDCDVTDDDDVTALFTGVREEFGGVDASVHMAYPRDETYGTAFERRDPDSWRANVDAQLNSYATLSREAIRAFDGDGALVNFGSTYGVQAPDFRVYREADMPPSPAHYSASKAAIVNLTRYLAAKYAPGVRANAVSPGGVFDDQDPAFVEAYEANTPMGRMAEPDDVAGAVVYLLSDAASYVTGHNLAVDGGWTIH